MGGETVHSSCPDVSLYLAVTLPPFIPLIHLVKARRRSHLKCNCLSLLLVGLLHNSREISHFGLFTAAGI